MTAAITSSELSPWRAVWRLIRATPWYFGGCTLLGVALFCALPTALGLAARGVFDAVEDGLGAGRAVLVLAGWQAVELVVGQGINRTWSGFSWSTQTRLQRNLLAGILRGFGRHGLPVSPGDAIGRFRDEPPGITMGSMDGVCDLVGRALFAGVAVVVMGRLSPLLTVAALAPIALSAAVSDTLGTRSSRYAAQARRSTTELTGFLGDVMAAQSAVRVAGAVDHVVARLDDLGGVRRRLSLRDRLFQEVVDSMNVHLVHLGTGAVLLLGAGEIRRGTFTVGDFALFVVFLDQLTYLPAEIGRVLTEMKRTRVSIDRLHALMPGESPATVVAPTPIHVRGPIPAAEAGPARVALDRLEIDGLTCVHPSSGRGVRDVSFAIERGSFTVVTGRVGAGKSTLVHALLGLLPASGVVRWNGVVVDDLATWMVPPQVAFTPQVPRLCSSSVRDNVLLGAAGDLDAAVHAAVLEGDLAGFAYGLDTTIGPRGVKLSGGQVQRVAAARMFVRRPELLVFDDLSSALDATTEAELWRRLLARRESVTCLVVSHSPVALAAADQVIALEG